MSIKNLLVEELSSQIEEVHKLEVGCEKYKTAVDGVAKLSDCVVEIEKLEQAESDNIAKLEAQKTEQELKANQMRDEKHDRWIRNGIEVAKFLGCAGLTTWVYITSMRYEDKGIIPTTEGGRAALKSLFKFMK